MKFGAWSFFGIWNLGLGIFASAQSLGLALPTDNDAIFRGGGPDFYQYVTRDFKGVKSTPWEGGQYGFVRDPVETSNGLVYTRFHEGIDIRPMHRDANGEPLDEVRAVADGEVVYVNTIAGYSNYGRYIVVEHRWNGSPYYSLYGHLSSPLVRPRAKVNRGDVLGVMGYTGEGLDKERAHLHLELNLMLSSRFESWYEFFVKNDPNHHGIYNGINLSGLDIARLYLALKENPSLTIPEFLAREEVFYKVTLPKTHNFELLQRYPWLLRGADKSAPSWEVSFNRAGVPLKVEPASLAASAPTLSYVKKGSVGYSGLTRGIINGSGSNAHFSENGEHLMRLLSWSN
ncbi:MAG: M23 family metallopeptidase [Verrucomicrobiota bacterium]|nr:M23 family metallopeptidase [Verrucomicrobiota bacterium]